MRKVIHGEIYFSPENAIIIKSIMLEFCSALRSAYQAIHKHNLKNNDIINYVKKNYMKTLNQRYIKDAALLASIIQNDRVIFGSKKLWKKYINKTISKSQWTELRNNKLYSRGDRSTKGNPNIRCENNIVKINDPTCNRKWIEGKLFIPKKWINFNHECYDARIIYINNKFKIKISYEIFPPKIISFISNGVIGIDINSDGIAVSNINYDGNLLKHFYIKKQRLLYASKNKKENDINILAKEIVQYAINVKKPIVLENLFFKYQKSKNKKLNRVKNNFCYRKIINAIKNRSNKFGIEIIEVNPAFTSILGQLKYKDMYSLNRHSAASLVIARRGLGIKEKTTFNIRNMHIGKEEKINLEGRKFSIIVTQKAYSYLAALTAQCLVPLINGIGHISGEIPKSESYSTTGRIGNIIDTKNVNITYNIQEEEGLPSKLILI